MKSTADLSEVLGATSALLLDFDGPICAIFSALPAPVVSQRLLALAGLIRGDVDRSLLENDDPLEVLRHADALGDTDLLGHLETELCRSELEAVAGAKATPFAAEAIKSARDAGRHIAIVSNNSDEAIRTYLAQSGLTEFVDGIVGRPFANPAQMKPDPRSVLFAVGVLQVEPSSAVLIGDSVSDIEAARNAGTRSIGFANRVGKSAKLAEAGAEAIVEGPESMGQIAKIYRSLAPWNS